MDALDREATRTPGGGVADGVRCHHAAQNCAQFKTYELFTSGLSRLLFLGRG